MKKQTIKNIDYGIACRVGNDIYLNKALKGYPKLRKAILLHEKNHTHGFTSRDLWLDLHIEELDGLKREYYKFVLKNPSSWIEFLPIKKYGDQVLFNLPIMVLWLFGGVMLWLVLRMII